MRLICGLGNPGREYEHHRHNVGFMVLQELARRLKLTLDQEKFSGRLAFASLAGERALLLAPQTFMNHSGQALAAAARFYKISPPEVLVVHDELDLPFGRLALKAGGGAGGHNGLRSILESWGEDGFCRLRFGIGKPTGQNAKDRVAGYVLSAFSKEEQAELPPLIAEAADACTVWAEKGLQTAMNRFNRRPAPRPPLT